MTTNKSEMPDIDAEGSALSLLDASGEEFPVLKAFQQYIDAEQNKARKRMLSLAIFFGVLLAVVVSVFVVLLNAISSRNQQLNDRLIEYVMRDRDRPQAAPVVVQPTVANAPQAADTTAIQALAAKMDDLQKKLAASELKAAEAQKAAAEAAKPKVPTAEELEIKRLKALLAAEKERQTAEKVRQAAEQEKRRQEELEAYRRKHYPELYEPPKAVQKKLAERSRKTKRRVVVEDPVEDEDIDEEETESDASTSKDADTLLDDDDAIDYFKEEKSPSGRKNYSIPVDVRGSKSRWRIPD